MLTLATEDIGKSYRGRRVVNSVSLHVNQGEVVGLLGPNGAGKTTTFYMIVGLTPPDSGRILIGDSEITSTVAAAGGQYAQAKHTIGPLMAFNVGLYLVFAYTMLEAADSDFTASHGASA